MRLASIVFAMLLFPAIASAKSEVSLDLARGDFAAQKAAISKAIQGAGLSEISSKDRKVVLDGLDDIEDALADAGSLQALAPADRDSLMAQQQAINASLDRAANDSRMTCRSEHVIGSNRPKRTCITVAAQKRQYEETQKAIGTGRRQISIPPPESN